MQGALPTNVHNVLLCQEISIANMAPIHHRNYVKERGQEGRVPFFPMDILRPCPYYSSFAEQIPRIDQVHFYKAPDS